MGRQESAKKLGRKWVILIGTLFLVPGLAILGLVGHSWLIYLRSANWDKVPATIERAELKSHRGEKRTTYSLICRYSYELGGKRYSSTRVSPMGFLSGKGKLHNRRLRILGEHLKSGEPFSAFVDPERPDSAILFREAHIFMYIGPQLGILFAIAGAGIMALGIFGMGNAKGPTVSREEYDNKPWLVRDDWRKFRSIPAMRKKLIFAWVVGILLPLIVSMFVFGIALGKAPIFAVIFIGLFVLLAIWKFLKAIIMTLRFVFHGKSELVLSRVPVSPGGKLEAVAQVRGHISPSGVSMRLSIYDTQSNKDSKSKPDLGGEKTSSVSALTVDGMMTEIYRRTLEFDESMASYDGQFTLLPVAFDIPAHLPPRRATDSDPLIWRLLVKARAFPVSLKVEFDLPVFAVEESEIKTRDGAAV